MSAEAGTINEERRKIEKGESMGGPKTLFYLPLSYRMTFFLPLGFQALAEYGLDPIPVIRHVGDRQDEKIPWDIFISAAVEYRYEMLGVGLQYEKYRGSVVSNWGKAIVNPDYQHEMLGLYAVLGM